MNKQQRIKELADILKRAYEKCGTKNCPQEKGGIADTADCATCEAQELDRKGYRKISKGTR